MFLDTFIYKYEDVSKHLSIIEALQIETFYIFKNLITYCKSDARYIIENNKACMSDMSDMSEVSEVSEVSDMNEFGCEAEEDNDNYGTVFSLHKLIERKHILDYIRFNNINL